MHVSTSSTVQFTTPKPFGLIITISSSITFNMATTTTTPTTNRSEYIGRVCRSWLDKKGKILDKHIRAPPVDGKVVRYWLEHSSDIRPASCCLCDLHISHPEGEYRIIVLPRPPRQERNGAFSRPPYTLSHLSCVVVLPGDRQQNRQQ